MGNSIYNYFIISIRVLIIIKKLIRKLKKATRKKKYKKFIAKHFLDVRRDRQIKQRV